MNNSESTKGYVWRRGIDPETKYFQAASKVLIKFIVKITKLQNVEIILDIGTN